VLHAARWKYRTQKSRQKVAICVPSFFFFSSSSSSSSVNSEMGPVVWGTPANFNGFRVLAALLHGSQVMSVSQTLRR